jgi:hypothetical protein
MVLENHIQANYIIYSPIKKLYLRLFSNICKKLRAEGFKRVIKEAKGFN